MKTKFQRFTNLFLCCSLLLQSVYLPLAWSFPRSLGTGVSSSDSEQDVQWQQSQESGISGEGTLKAGGKLHMKGNVVVDIAELEANLLTFEEVIDKFHNITTGSSFGIGASWSNKAESSKGSLAPSG
ncbi:MAG: hypothetical protein LBI29_04500, partial [Rickettsiales bacterium]|nr:hypothetical protein [Rickettsiales bacterium]